MSESALFAVKLQPQRQTNRFVVSLSHQVAEQQISKRFSSASLTLLVLNKQNHGCRLCFLWTLQHVKREGGRLWNKRMCFFSISVDLITFWIFGKSFVILWLNILFHKKFEASRLQVDNCSLGASLCILHIIVDTVQLKRGIQWMESDKLNYGHTWLQGVHSNLLHIIYNLNQWLTLV